MTNIIKRLQRFRLPISLLLAVAALIVAASSATYSYFGIDKVVRFRDRLIERKYEGSLSEDLGFLTVLATEISQSYDFESDEEFVKTRQIETYLGKIKEELDRLEPRQENSGRNVDVLEYLSDRQALVDLFFDPALSSFTVEQLGLVRRQSGIAPGRPCLESFAYDQRPMRSFVFIPATLVDADPETGRLDVAPIVKREIVFSKLVEAYLLNIREDLGGIVDIDQAYFIPFSGFTRILSYKSVDQLNYYGGLFSPLKSFSDRTYFSKTQARTFRRTEPYVDTAGGGIVVTYTIYILNEEMNMMGIIGIDRNVGTLDQLWEEPGSGLGSGAYFGAKALRDFDFVSHQLADGSDNKSLPAEGFKSFEDWVVGELNRNPGDVSRGIRRWSSAEYKDWSDEKETVFTVPLGGGRIGCFVFNADKVEGKYKILMYMYAGSLSSVLIIPIVLYFYRRSQVAERGKEEVEALQSEIVSNLHGGFLIVDDSGLVLLYNDRIREMVGYPSLDGVNLRSILTADSYNEYTALASPSGFEFPGKIRDASGDTRSVIVASSAIARGEFTNSSMLIIIPSEELEVTIGSKFVHSFSHALKTPAHSILLIADNFRRKRGYRNFDYYYGLMERQIREFASLIDNVLYFSELELKILGRTEKSENVSQVLRSSVRVAEARAKGLGLEFASSISDKLLISVDLDIFRIVFNNLIDNALKYTKEGEITVQAIDRLDHIKIVVADTGIGVRPEDCERIFEMFFRGESRDVREQEGLGIGLYVSRRYISMLGGKLYYESLSEDSQIDGDDAELHGSRFVVELPKG